MIEIIDRLLRIMVAMVPCWYQKMAAFTIYNLFISNIYAGRSNLAKAGLNGDLCTK